MKGRRASEGGRGRSREGKEEERGEELPLTVRPHVSDGPPFCFYSAKHATYTKPLGKTRKRD